MSGSLGATAHRRAAAALLLAAAGVTVSAGPAGAHALGLRGDLPLPLWLFAYGAGTAVVISFAILGLLWPSSRFENQAGRALPRPVQAAAPVLALLARALGLFLFVAVFLAALLGNERPEFNVAPRAVYTVFWVGLTVVSALAGDVWRVLSPFDTICAAGQRLRRLAGRPDPAPRDDLPDLGHWPAAVLLFGFVWLELIFPERDLPRTVATAMAAYTVVVLAGAATWGRSWLREGEAFAAFFSLVSHMAPLYRAGDGRLRLRPPLAGLAGLRVRPGTAALVLVALGSTGFDGFIRTGLWQSIVAGQGDALLLHTAGLAWMVVAVGIVYAGSMRVAALITGRDPGDLVESFLGCLVPVTFAYLVAHYFSHLVFEGQSALALASDHLGRGWDLFGTATWLVNFDVISAATIVWVQAAAIVLGVIAGLLVAYDRALACFRGTTAARAQYPLVGAMVLYTVGGLTLLLGA